MIHAKLPRLLSRRHGGTRHHRSQLRLGPIVLTTKARQERSADRLFSAGADIALHLGFNPIAEMQREDAERDRRSHLRAV